MYKFREDTDAVDLIWTLKDWEDGDKVDLTWRATLDHGYWLVPEERYRRCQKAIKQEAAVVNIILDSPQITQITKNARVSFSDKLGIIGQ